MKLENIHRNFQDMQPAEQREFVGGYRARRTETLLRRAAEHAKKKTKKKSVKVTLSDEEKELAKKLNIPEKTLLAAKRKNLKEQKELGNA